MQVGSLSEDRKVSLVVCDDCFNRSVLIFFMCSRASVQ